jgi:hypothetical protein
VVGAWSAGADVTKLIEITRQEFLFRVSRVPWFFKPPES